VLAHVTATRYVTPLREGGSLPGLMEADDYGTYVVKFTAAGQGRKALVAEVIAAGLARGLGLSVPELVTIDVDPGLANGEPDQEVQDLLRASAGTNLGIDFLPGALDFEPTAFPIDRLAAGRVLWFDAVIGNMDRSYRNPNLLEWRGLWLIDHGASLSFHHRWASAPSYDDRPYEASDHVLVVLDPDVLAADGELGPLLTPELIDAAVADVPDAWIDAEPGIGGPDEVRAAYATRLVARLAARDQWLPALAESAARRGTDRRAPVHASKGRPDWLTGPSDGRAGS
jgi:hypothetical protein